MCLPALLDTQQKHGSAWPADQLPHVQDVDAQRGAQAGDDLGHNYQQKCTLNPA